MKQQKFFGIILVICVLVPLTGCASATTFDGSRVKNADSYQLDIKTMNCTDTHTLELEQGDTLKIEFETENGNLSMKITAPDGTALYQGDGTVKEFTVEVPMDGAYPIVVVGQKAKGSIHIDVERVPEAVEPEETQEPESVTLTTVYKLADGTYMDRIERRFTYNGTDPWTDEDGVDWKLLVLKM